MGKEALSIGANTFQFFTRNPRGVKAKPLNVADMKALAKLMGEHAFAPIMAHAPYTLNACAKDGQLRRLAADVITDDLLRLEYLPGNYYNFHPGSHVGQGVEAGIRFIADMLNQVLKPDQQTTVLLETMAGKGSEVGGRFEELRNIIDMVELGGQMGVCLDTCHVFDAGYDVVNSLDEVLAEFDEIIGIKFLRAIHLNDSKNILGSQKDRHAPIGDGYIGLDAFVCIINHPQLRSLPFYLETPQELPGYADEIKLLRSLYA